MKRPEEEKKKGRGKKTYYKKRMIKRLVCVLIYIDTGNSSPAIKHINAAVYDRSSGIGPHILSNDATCHLSILHLTFMLHTFHDESHFKNIIS